jgi:putative membrane-bound dehydrogenase-like protein
LQTSTATLYLDSHRQFMIRNRGRILCVLGVSLTFTTHAGQFKFPNQTLTVPDGFEVELVATTDLAPRPVSGSFDEQGRLYVTDSSGSNEKPDKQLANPMHRVLRLEDTNGDGKFDKSTVFADKVMFPEGCLWYNGSVYVAAPPSIWKFTDTNNDGAADVRVEWHQGKTLTGCANDLHGPYLGPDGWIYWCKGAFAEQTYDVNGKPFKSRAAHIFRARPDHSGLEPVLTGGMDNPVGVAFTPEGERIMCGTFFAPHEPGHRDGLIHAIYGGVYGKINNVTDDHKKTGDLMPIMTHMGPAAPCSVIRYESRVLGDEFRDNLFCCQFNLHKVSRHVLAPDGATFKTTDSDFLFSDSVDFHPTDVIEDADGSLIVLDTGAWYKLCCPTSQLAKPDVLGAIYRIRRIGAPRIDDPRGLKIAWGKMKPAELVKVLGDERPAVANRAIHELSKLRDASVPVLREVAISGKEVDLDPARQGPNPSYEEWKKAQLAAMPYKTRVRQNALWCLTRIESPAAREAVRTALSDCEKEVRQVAYASMALHRDKIGGAEALPARSKSTEVIRKPEWRAIFELLGRTGVFSRDMALGVHLNFEELMIHDYFRTNDDWRVLRHSLSYALIESDRAEAARLLLDSFELAPAALIALDQMDHGGLRPEEVIPSLSAKDPAEGEKEAAFWIINHHPEWGGALAGFFRERVTDVTLTDTHLAELERQLANLAANEVIQKLMADTLNASSTSSSVRQLLLRAMARVELKRTPKFWPDAVGTALDEKDDALVRVAIATARSLGQIKTNTPNFAERLQGIARDTSRPDDLRLDALAALPRGLASVEPDLLSFLFTNLDPAKSVAMRSAAVGALAKAKLSEEQLLTLADTLKNTGPLEVSKVLPAFEHTTNETVGLRLVAALKESKGSSGVNPGALKTLAAKYPPTVQQKADELLATLNVDAAKQKAHLDELTATLPKGDIRRGQAIFNSTKAACAACHKMGYVGGNVGPDLTSIGQVRTEQDLLESIVYPSASFVRSYEPVILLTKSDEEYSGVLLKDAPDEVVLATGPNTEARVSRSDIAEMRPGRVSVMPGGLDEQLSKQELADLVAFLKGTKWGPN